MNEKCFAMKKFMTHSGNCLCLEGNCPGYAVCPFYKPVWKFQHDLEIKYAKLAALPERRQQHIAYKYYHGLMPWRRDTV